MPLLARNLSSKWCLTAPHKTGSKGDPARKIKHHSAMRNKVLLEIDTFVSQELVVEVVFDFGHIGGDVDMFQEFFRKVAAS